MANETVTENTDNDPFPNAEELEALYLLLENSIPELQWKSPGRVLEEDKVEKPVEENLEIHEQGNAKTDFDFSDDMAQPQLRTVTNRTTPKSAKKKTANFADILQKFHKP